MTDQGARTGKHLLHRAGANTDPVADRNVLSCACKTAGDGDTNAAFFGRNIDFASMTGNDACGRETC